MKKAVLRNHPEGGGSLQFRYDPDVIDTLKSCRWRWDPAQKFWWASPDNTDAGVAAMTLLGYEIVDVRAGVQPPPPVRDPQVVDRTAFYEAMFRRLRPEDRPAKHRDLMRAFHPDAHGDPEEAKAINAAYDRVLGRNRRGA